MLSYGGKSCFWKHYLRCLRGSFINSFSEDKFCPQLSPCIKGKFCPFIFTEKLYIEPSITFVQLLVKKSKCACFTLHKKLFFHHSFNCGPCTSKMLTFEFTVVRSVEVNQKNNNYWAKFYCVALRETHSVHSKWEQNLSC